MNWKKPVLHYGLKLTNIPRILAEIPSWEYASKAKLDAMVNEKLWNLLAHTWSKVSYYYNLVSKEPLISFNQIPPLTRDMINTIPSQLLACDYAKRGCLPNCSGGSSGHPIRFYQGKEYRDWNIATKIWYKLQAGQQFGDRECRIWGIDRKLSMKKRLMFWGYNRKEFQGFCLDERQMEKYARWIQRNKPTWIEAYTDSMDRFCRYVDGTLPSPKGVLVSGGTLTPEMRARIEGTFKCKVYNRYGSREVGAIACDCPKGNLHVSSWNAHVEIIENKIYVTSLRNFSMPLIRYDIGDMASGWGTCDCGRKTPVIANIEGRSIEMFRTKDGRYISGIFFSHLFGVMLPKKEVKEVQAIQNDYNLITLSVVLHDNNNMPYFGDWKTEIRKMMGENVFVSIKFVNELTRLLSGKICYTMCMIK